MGKSRKSPKVSAKSDVVELSKRQAKEKAKKTAREKQKARIKHALDVKRATQLENCVNYCLQQKPPIISARGIFRADHKFKNKLAPGGGIWSEVKWATLTLGLGGWNLLIHHKANSTG